MALIHWPLPISLTEAQLPKNAFPYYSKANTEEESPIHGRGHIHRVICLGLQITKNIGREDLLPSIFAAAHLHDLARDQDGTCHKHGARAAKHLFQIHHDLYIKAGLTEENIPSVLHAVTEHCLNRPADPSSPHYALTALLKDADALDRCRLGINTPKDCNPNYLHFERNKLHINKARELFLQTFQKGEDNLSTVWERCVSIFNPLLGLSKTTPLQKHEETADTRRNRRLSLSQYSSEIQTAVAELSIPKAQTWIAKNLPPEDAQALETYATSHQAVTCLTEENYQKFLHSGRFLGFWESPTPPNTKFHESPEDTRCLSDLRLFGEKAHTMTYGLLLVPQLTKIPPQLGGDTTLPRAKAHYGDVALLWKPEVLQSATFCMNDSQEVPFVLPYTVFPELVRRKLINQMRYASNQPPLFPEIYRGKLLYWETQLHQELTPHDVASLL